MSAGGSAALFCSVISALFCCPPQEKEMEKQRLLYQQSRLHNRGAAEMVLQMISACKGTTVQILFCDTKTIKRTTLTAFFSLFKVNQEPWFLLHSNLESPSSMEATVMCSRCFNLLSILLNVGEYSKKRSHFLLMQS